MKMSLVGFCGGQDRRGSLWACAGGTSTLSESQPLRRGTPAGLEPTPTPGPLLHLYVSTYIGSPSNQQTIVRKFLF